MGRKVDQGRYLPTQEEIARECQRIRESWTPQEERRRRFFNAPADDDRYPDDHDDDLYAD